MTKEPDKLDDEISRLLKTVTDTFEKEDRATREAQMRHCRRLKLYWNNMNRIYWSETARDYRLASNLDTNGSDLQQAYYDKPINVFRAFLETIIAALSIQVPAVNCVPDNAESPLDLATAKAGNIISQQVYKHNDAIMLWLQALYVYCTEGMIAIYSYPKKDKLYGEYEDKEYKDETVEGYICPECNANLSDEAFSNAVEDSYGPGEDEVEVLDVIDNLGPICPECGALLDENLEKQQVLIPRLIGVTKKPKSRICMEVYGNLYVKVANYAKKQADTPYLIQTFDTHYANVIEQFEHLRDKLSVGSNNAGGGISGYDSYDTAYRANVQYGGQTPEGQVTVRNSWLRPASFNVLPEADYNKLKTKFPSGCYVTFVNDYCAQYCNESLDDVWTLSRNPTSDYLTHEPMGELVTNVQDIINDLISLTLQSIEHATTQMWADPSVVDFEGQSQIEANPGMITAVKAAAGKNISDAFFASTAAKLPPEVFSFFRIVQELGQFASGAMPSLFGGAQVNKTSRTASEYAMQKGMALQRLQTPWKMLTNLWKDAFGKVIPAYMKLMQEDERIVTKDKSSGNYINTFLIRAEMAGKIGEIELEGSDQLPISDEQKAETIMRLMELNQQEIQLALADPDNLPFVRKVVKIPEFKLPGEADRIKQYDEINMMLNLIDVTVDPEIDNHMLEAEICRGWLISEAGREAKIMNENGYMLIVMHYMAHKQLAAQIMMQASQAGQGEDNPDQKKLPAGKSKNSGQEIKGDSDVRA